MPQDDDLPTGIALSTLDPTFREDPHAILHRLRAAAPVHRQPEWERVLLTRYEDARAMLADRSLSMDLRNARPGVPTRAAFGVDDPDKPYEPMILVLDDPDHRRIRSLMSQAFNQRTVDAFRPRIRRIAEELLDGLAGSSRFDLIARFARPLPVIVIAEMMGVGGGDLADFTAWSDAQDQINNPLRTPEQEQRRRWGESSVQEYFAREIEARRGRGGDDLISRLVAAEEDGARLSQREIVVNCNILMIAGNLTTTDLIANGTLALLRHPDQLAQFKRADAALVRNAVEEMLRYDPPATNAMRVAREERELGGVRVEAGQAMVASLLAAGRDPAANPDPDRFDIARREPRHLAFGGGVHFCLGAPLARAEAEVALPLLFERFPDLRLDPERPLRRKAIYGFNGLEALWVMA